MNRTATPTPTHRHLTSRAVVVLTALAASSVPATGAQALQRPDREHLQSAQVEVPCFMGRHDWPTGLVGPRPTCSL